MIAQMFALMYEARGVGLAANQVDLPLRFFIANLEAEAGKGEELVFLNPIISKSKGTDEAEEGCLSLPGLYGQVARPKQVRINAYNLSGQEIVADVTGMLARVVQHELDHLDGVLFIDRMTETRRAEIENTVGEFEIEFQSRRSVGEIPDDAELARRRAEWEKKYC